jgi:hypothetical protein
MDSNRGPINGYKIIMIRPAGSKPLVGLSAAYGLAALRAYLVFSVSNYEKDL